MTANIRWSGVVKLQRALFPPPPDDAVPVLVYNEDRSILYQAEYGFKDIVRLFEGGAEKAYWKAELGDDGGLDMVEQVDAEDW